MLPNFPDYIGSLQISNKKQITLIYNKEDLIDMEEISCIGRRYKGCDKLAPNIRDLYTCIHKPKVDMKFTQCVFKGQYQVSCLKIARHYEW